MRENRVRVGLMEKLIGKLDSEDVKTLIELMRGANVSRGAQETIATMMKKESRTRLHSEASGPPGVRSASAAAKSGIIGLQGVTHRCYNCGKVGHLSKICPRPPKERTGGCGQPGGYGCGCDGCRGGLTEGYRANLTVAKEEKETRPVFSKDDYEMMKLLEKKWRLASDGGKNVNAARAFTPSRDNIAGYARTSTDTHTHAHASIPTNRSPEWIVDSGASRHVTGASTEFSSYHH